MPILILFSNLLLVLPRVIFHSGFPLKILYAFYHLSHVYNMFPLSGELRCYDSQDEDAARTYLSATQ
jgi:hypothetical protein